MCNLSMRRGNSCPHGMLIQNTSLGSIDPPPPAEADVTESPAKESTRKTARADPSNALRMHGIPPPKQILVIDDDREVRGLVARTIVMAGFHADTAEDGEEGWRALCSRKYDLVITDHEMPNLSGLKLIERMRAVSIEPPCILISANPPLPEPDLRKIVHRGTVLPKPFSATELIERVYGLLLLGNLES
jgi:CheY-like chemotaxis protein